MRVRASQLIFLLSFVAFIIGYEGVGIALLFFGFSVMMLETLKPERKKEEEDEEEIIKPVE